MRYKYSKYKKYKYLYKILHVPTAKYICYSYLTPYKNRVPEIIINSNLRYFLNKVYPSFSLLTYNENMQDDFLTTNTVIGTKHALEKLLQDMWFLIDISWSINPIGDHEEMFDAFIIRGKLPISSDEFELVECTEDDLENI